MPTARTKVHHPYKRPPRPTPRSRSSSRRPVSMRPRWGINLDLLWFQRAWQSLPSISHSAVPRDRTGSRSLPMLIKRQGNSAASRSPPVTSFFAHQRARPMVARPPACAGGPCYWPGMISLFLPDDREDLRLRRIRRHRTTAGSPARSSCQQGTTFANNPVSAHARTGGRIRPGRQDE